MTTKGISYASNDDKEGDADDCEEGARDGVDRGGKEMHVFCGSRWSGRYL